MQVPPPLLFMHIVALTATCSFVDRSTERFRLFSPIAGFSKIIAQLEVCRILLDFLRLSLFSRPHFLLLQAFFFFFLKRGRVIAAGSSERLANHKAEVVRGREWQGKEIAACTTQTRRVFFVEVFH